MVSLVLISDCYISGDMFFNPCVSHPTKLPWKPFNPVKSLKKTNKRKLNLKMNNRCC